MNRKTIVLPAGFMSLLALILVGGIALIFTSSATASATTQPAAFSAAAPTLTISPSNPFPSVTVTAQEPPPAAATPTPTSSIPPVEGMKSDLDQFFRQYDLRDAGGPRLPYEEMGDRGYQLPEDLGIEPNFSDRFFSPLKQVLMQYIVWVSGLSMRMVGGAFFSDLFSDSIGTVAYKLMEAQQQTIFKPLVIMGGAVLLALYGWYFLQKEDSEHANRLLVTATAAVAFAMIVFAAPAVYFGAAIDGTTSLSGALVGSVGQISKDLTVQNDNLVGSDQSVALRRITNSIHETATTQVWCHSVMKSQVTVDKYCGQLRTSRTISTSEQEKIDTLPIDQRADARSQLIEKKQAAYSSIVEKICAEDPGSCQRIKGFDGSVVFILLLLSAFAISAMVLVIGVLALVVVLSRFMYFLSISVGPDVVPLALLGDFGQRLFKMWLWLGVILQLLLQIAASLILSLALVFTYGVFAIVGMPWGLKLLIVGILFTTLFKRRNTVFAKLLGGSENARANVGLHILNKGMGVSSDYADSHRPNWARSRGSSTDSDYDDERDLDEDERSEGRSRFGRLRRQPNNGYASQAREDSEADSSNKRGDNDVAADSSEDDYESSRGDRTDQHQESKPRVGRLRRQPDNGASPYDRESDDTNDAVDGQDDEIDAGSRHASNNPASKSGGYTSFRSDSHQNNGPRAAVDTLERDKANIPSGEKNDGKPAPQKPSESADKPTRLRR